MSDPQAQPAQNPKGKNTTAITCAILGVVLGCGGIGVVGVLAAIAVPNFIKFQCKSLQSEAKMNLRSLYIAEQSFRAEHGFYTSDLVALNWYPSGEPRYLYGFAYYGPESVEGGPSDHDVERSDTLHEDVIAKGGFSTAKMVTKGGEELYPEDLPEDSYVEKDEFVAAAVADIREDPFGTLDIWTIDENGSVTAVDDDCN